MKFEHEKTNEILKWFEEIASIPRCSKHEEKICKWLLDWAEEHNFEIKKDKVNNILIKIPGSEGYENSKTVVIQGHMDIVCEKEPDSDHDFTKDPIKMVYDGEWLTADKTTLGADDGIAIAIGLVLALDKDNPHPPLELLFTVDEETGLTGANALEPGFIDGKILINIDSEDEGVFTVGCAGGINTNLSLPMDYEDVPYGFKQFKIKAGGMKGGHSGIDIGIGKANAIKILARVLYEIKKKTDIRISDIKGGSAHNAIPRDVEAAVFLLEKDFNKVQNIISDCNKILIDEYKLVDPNIKISIEDNGKGNCKQALTVGNSQKLIEFIFAIPHGVAAMSNDVGGLIETSNNFANIKIEDNTVKVLTSQRSSVMTRLYAITYVIEAIARLAGGEAKSGDGYPAWHPNMDSPLLARSVKLYEKLFNKKPVVEIIHAGLECGIIGDKYPGMDMISIGPDLRYPHSPEEKVHVGTIGKIWDFTVALLKELK